MLFDRKQRFDWAFVLAVGDIVMMISAIVLTSVVYDVIPLWNGRFHGLYPAWLGRGLVFASVNFFLMRRALLYTWSTLNSRVGRPLVMFWTCACSGAVLYGLDFLLGARPPGTLEWTVLQVGTGTLLLWLGRLAMHSAVLRNRFGYISQERIAFVGPAPRVEKVIHALQSELGRFQVVVGYFEIRPSLAPRTHRPRYYCLGPLDRLEEIVSEQEVTLLILDARIVPPSELREIVAICSRRGVRFRMIPDAFDMLTQSLTTRMVAGIALMGPGAVPLDFLFNRVRKRCVDIVGALVGLLISVPIVAVLGILIQMESPGPIFYRQWRLGLHGTIFEMIKLRSMKLDAEAGTGPRWTTKNDPRRLRIGAFMRSWNLDELPQFWNVLKGDMSLVGPRPERPELAAKFTYDIRHYNLRHNCKPGMTSWAAINGWRGNTSLTHRLQYDLYYLENWSLSFDFRILFRTLLPPKNAY